MNKHVFRKTLVALFGTAGVCLFSLLPGAKSESVFLGNIGSGGWFSSAPVQQQAPAEAYGLIAVINHEESLRFEDYSTSDFGLGQNYELIDMTSSFRNQVQTKDPAYLALGKFRRILLFKRIRNSVNLKQDFVRLANNPSIVSIEYAMDVEGSFSSPNDPLYAYNSNYAAYQWYLSKINVEDAWNVYTTGSSNLKIGVIDTGCYIAHEDFDSNRFPSIMNGLSFAYDVYSSRNAPFSPETFSPYSGIPQYMYGHHGTMVTGIIAAKRNNSKGIAGMTDGVKISVLRADSPFSYGYGGHETVEGIIAAINHANSLNLPILNFSGGFEYPSGSNNGVTVNSSNLYSLKQQIMNYSGLLVVAAGNSNANIDTSYTKTYPAAWDLSNVIAVGASDDSDSRCNFSNYGSSSVGLFAPGINILSLTNESASSYSNNLPHDSPLKKGTSFAAPQVTGAAALLKSYYTSMDCYEIKQSIFNGVDYVSSLSSLCKTNGRLNVYGALANPHFHTFVYTNASSIKHRITCTANCGYDLFEVHQWDGVNSYVNGNTTYGKCAICGYYFPI